MGREEAACGVPAGSLSVVLRSEFRAPSLLPLSQSQTGLTQLQAVSAVGSGGWEGCGEDVGGGFVRLFNYFLGPDGTKASY